MIRLQICYWQVQPMERLGYERTKTNNTNNTPHGLSHIFCTGYGGCLAGSSSVRQTHTMLSFFFCPCFLFQLWFCSTWSSCGEWSDLFPKSSFFGSSSSSSSSGTNIINSGVTDIVTNGLDILVCGSDGSVKWLHSKRHYATSGEGYIPSQISVRNSASKLATPIVHFGQC